MRHTQAHTQNAYEAGKAGPARSALPVLVSGLVLMAGAFASSSAQAQAQPNTPCLPPGYLGIGGTEGTGLAALTSTISTVNTAFMNQGSAFVVTPSGVPNQQVGGVWIRAVGGSTDTKANAAYDGFNLNTEELDHSSCSTTVRQDFKGVQFGHDIGLLNSDNSGMNWHFGAMAGYVQSDFRDVSPGGRMHGNFNVPFAGLYTAFSKGNFFADAQARFDYYQGEITDPLNALDKVRLDAHGYALTGNIGYRFDLGGSWSLEPSVGGVLSRTWVDPLAMPTAIGEGGYMLWNSTMRMSEIRSELGRASIKVGTVAALGETGIVAYPFFSASLFREFAGKTTASLWDWGTGPGTDTPPLKFGDLTSNRIGTYAQFSVGSAFVLADTDWLGFARVDYRTGDNIEGISINGGLRYQFSGNAGGLKEGGSLKDGPVAGYSWTGPYVGVSAGGTWGNTHWTNERPLLGNLPRPDYAGYLAGGQLGYNYQSGRFVWGVEADYHLSNARGAGMNGGSATDAGSFCGLWWSNTSCENDVKALGSVTGRLGYTFGRALLYGKGGWAFGKVRAGTHMGSPDIWFPEFTSPASTTQWMSGWTAGGGMEFALNDKWSARAEYMHYEFPEKSFQYGAVIDVAQSARVSVVGDTVTVGVNYHLNGGNGGWLEAPLK